MVCPRPDQLLMNATPSPFDLWPEPPRAWQVRAYATLWPIIRSREPVIMQAATGTGKSRLQLAVVASVLRNLREGYRVVVSVPKQDLVRQTYEEADRVLPRSLGTRTVGRWYGHRKEDARVIIACHDSMQSLADHLGVHGLKVAFWLADECHRADIDEVRTAVERMQPWTRLGVTATPFRAAKTEPLRGWKRLAFSYPIDEAIRDGVLVPPRFVLPTDDVEVEDVNAWVCDAIQRKAPPGPGIVSAVDIADAEFYAGYLTDAGVAAAAVHSRSKDRADKIRALLAGRYRCLVHVDLLTEGVDVPPLRWLAERRDRGSAVAIVQSAGRVLRTCKPDQWGEKTEAVILLPHSTPVLRSMARLPSLTLRMEALQRAAEQEVEDEEERHRTIALLPAGEAALEVGDWMARLAAAVGKRLDLTPPLPGDEWRHRVPSTRQIQALERITANGRTSPVRFLPSKHRDAVRKVIVRPETLTAGAMSDLQRVLYALMRANGEHRDRFGHSPDPKVAYWSGLRDLVGCDPPELAVKAIHKGNLAAAKACRESAT